MTKEEFIEIVEDFAIYDENIFFDMLEDQGIYVKETD